jgi:hypothetical protein
MSHLIETLYAIQKRPGMYFGNSEDSRSIHVLFAFIVGFETGQGSSDKSRDFDCFREWIGLHYHTLVDGQGWLDLILEHVSDPKLAYDEFFRLLPTYVKDRQELGWDGIHSRFGVVQEGLWEQFSKDLEKE